MLSADPKESGPLGADYRAVLLYADSERVPLRICIVARESSDPVGGPFVLLRDLADASIYLGCVCDAAGEVREWLEIWVQNTTNFRTNFPGQDQHATNRLLDERWLQRAELYRALEPESFISTCWEATPPPPIFFDLRLRAPVHPVDSTSSTAWQLCRDDALLNAKGLPEYSHSLAKYLYQPGTDGPLLPATPDAPENASTQKLFTALGNLVPFNPAGGLMMLRQFSPLNFEDFVDLLSGQPWRGIQHGKKMFRPPAVYRTLQDANAIQQGQGHLFTGPRGRAGQLAECFHLKLHLLTAALRVTRTHVQNSQLPFLNLTAESFQVRLHESDAALPHFWNFKVVLATPPGALALPVQSTTARYFLPPNAGEMSIYRASEGMPVEGYASIRVREVITKSGEEVVLVGTLVTQERITLSANDLIWLRVSLPSGRIDLYANLDPNSAPAPGEIRFRTLPQQLSEAAITALREAEGVGFAKVPFATLPLLSTPCDLYSVAILAIRTLLVDNVLTLSVAVDEMVSLGRQIAASYDASKSLEERLSTLFANDPDRAAMLGPHRLQRAKVTPEESLQFFPYSLWTDALALILRLIPGLGPDSFCRDYGHAPPLALHTVFDEPLASFEQLLVRSRSLILTDWQANREIGSIIRSALGRYPAGPQH